MAEGHERDVVIVGGGVAGRTAGIFTARHGLSTTILDAGSPLLRRNAHLENFPGFPTGINARLLLDMMLAQAERAGCTYREAEVTQVRANDGGFDVETADGDTWRSRYVIAATKNEVGYLAELEDVEIVDRGKLFVATDEHGRTGLEGLYVAGRMAEKPHQAIVNAGHGAEVAVTLLEDDEAPFYHDWVAPTGYFTGRDRAVPPGCEEIDRGEGERREAEDLGVLRSWVDDPELEPPEQHPNVQDGA